LPFDPDHEAWKHIDEGGEHWFERFSGGGVRIHWAPLFDNAGGRAEDTDYTIYDQSLKSRLRAAFEFGQATCRWGFMLTLTWPLDEKPMAEDLKKILRKFERNVNSRYGCGLDAWLMEFTLKGCPHFHVFIALESEWGKVLATMPTEIFTKRVRGKTVEREVVRGSADNWAVQTWTDIIRDKSERTMRFQKGGIIEVMRSHDAAGRYAAKEAAKRQQKKLPDHYAQGVGRWWFLDRRWAKRLVETGPLDIDAYPMETPCAYVWSSETLGDSLGEGASEPMA
jgi:hypothetical protein